MSGYQDRSLVCSTRPRCSSTCRMTPCNPRSARCSPRNSQSAASTAARGSWPPWRTPMRTFNRQRTRPEKPSRSSGQVWKAGWTSSWRETPPPWPSAESSASTAEQHPQTAILVRGRRSAPSLLAGKAGMRGLRKLEATGGFEPPNRGFADLRLRPLGYVAWNSVGAEEETRTPTALAATAPSTLRVYQFHHLGAHSDDSKRAPRVSIAAAVRAWDGW